MNTLNYEYLIGKNKNEVVKDLGSEFNYFQSHVWFYYLSTNWIGQKTYLLILFKEEIVHKIKLKKSFSKIR